MGIIGSGGDRTVAHWTEQAGRWAQYCWVIFKRRWKTRLLYDISLSLVLATNFEKCKTLHKPHKTHLQPKLITQTGNLSFLPKPTNLPVYSFVQANTQEERKGKHA